MSETIVVRTTPLALHTIGNGSLNSEFEEFVKKLLIMGEEQISAIRGGDPLYATKDRLLEAKFKVEVTAHLDPDKATLEVVYKVSEVLPGRRSVATATRIVNGSVVVELPDHQDPLPFHATLKVN